jgi:cyclophilin family peptidyl-prolyl cis-trans isomerase
VKTLWNWLAARKAACSVVDSVAVAVSPAMVESLEDRCFLSVAAPHVVSVVADNRGVMTIKVDQKLNPTSVSSKSVKVWKTTSGADQAITNAGISYSATKRTITIDAHIPANTMYKVRLVSKVIKSTAGVKLDGEFKPTGKSGNGKAGGDWFGMTAPRAATDQIALFATDYGNILVNMFEEKTATVGAFSGYANDGSWDGMIFHRSAFVDQDANTFDPFVLQGGAFKVDASNRYTTVHTNPPTITNEPGISNLKGTIAMARVGGQVNSATDQFFFNMKDNTFLDTVDQGFTVFGATNSAGMKVLTKIMKTTIQANATGAGASSFFVNPGRDQGAFSELPVKQLASFSPKDHSTFVRRLSMLTQVVKGVRA